MGEEGWQSVMTPSNIFVFRFHMAISPIELPLRRIGGPSVRKERVVHDPWNCTYGHTGGERGRERRRQRETKRQRERANQLEGHEGDVCFDIVYENASVRKTTRDDIECG